MGTLGRAPLVKDREVQQALNELYERLNILSDSVNLPDQQGRVNQSDGLPGDIRLVTGDDRKYYLQARFKDGWVTTAQDVMQFQNVKKDAPAFMAGKATPGNIPIELALSGVTPGDYVGVSLSVDEFGRITAASSGSALRGVAQAVASVGTKAVTFSSVGTTNYFVDGFVLNSAGRRSFIVPHIPPLTDSRTQTGLDVEVFDIGTLYLWLATY